MSFMSSWYRRRLLLATALPLLAGAGVAHGADTFNPKNGQLSMASVAIGNAIYSNMVVTVGSIVTAPSGASPNGVLDNYDPSTGQLTVEQVTVGPTTYYNAVVTVTGLVSIGSVVGADSYDGHALTIGSVLYKGTIYNDVVITVGNIVSFASGMPSYTTDVYGLPTASELTIPAVQFDGRVYTNVVIAVGKILSTAIRNWAWMSGSNQDDASGVYGIEYTASSGNVAGNRMGGASWIDTGGNLWQFGGYYSVVLGGTEFWENDLWRYSPASGLWTWMGGSSSPGAAGVYGEQRVPAAGNVPGARWNASSWTDGQGNFWLFGGGAFGGQNDLWEYSPVSGLWTWVSGTAGTINPVGICSSQGSPSQSNAPGGRQSAVSWIDGSGNLWLFGGNGISCNANGGLLNDLWEYSPTAQTWTWVGGSAAPDALAVYGTKGVAAAGNDPGSRRDAVSWIDAAGNLWLFGGQGTSAGGASVILNDLWQFNPATGLWTWVSGTNSSHVPGIYGTQGLAGRANMPGSRASAVAWSDKFGNLWLFGGGGFDKNNSQDQLNDLWKYNVASGLWTWMSGSSAAPAFGIYGTLDTPAPGNAPGGREKPIGWTDANGDFWLFGGAAYDASGNTGYGNDLWRY